MEQGELMCCAVWLDRPSSVTFDRVQAGTQLAYIGWPTADAAKRIQSRASLYMAEQYG